MHCIAACARLGSGSPSSSITLLRDDLPRQPVLVLEPAARPRLTAVVGQTLPEVVHLGLVLAAHRERDRLVEAEVSLPTVQQLELLPVDLENRHQNGAGRLRPAL